MKVGYRWIREFVRTDVPAAEIADRLTNAGIPVEQVSPVVEGLAGAVVGEIAAIERELGAGASGHVNRLCRVAVPGGSHAVVCGAPNARVGLRAPFAPPGATLGGKPVRAARIRGVVSEGILCSERDLGISDDHGGLLELPADAPLGADLAEYLGLDDWILDVEIMPNRPDVLSVVGVAREIAALTGAPLAVPRAAVAEGADEAARMAAVEILDPDLCPRYAARVITGLTVAPSPPWLAQRLRAAGLRPINNLVDVTNYVMWELGQPLHAFDHATLPGGRIVVRRARPGERLTTLDGRERVLAPDMLMICDAERPVAVAGVMGGAATEVTAATRTVLLESASFHPGSVRRTSRALGLSSEAAYRFERGVDAEGAVAALDRAAQLMAELGGGRVARGVVDVYPAPRPAVRVPLRLERVERLIGATPERAEAVRILRALGCGVDDGAATLQVDVPSFRRDLVQEDDLVEEVVRIWGFDKIPVTLAPGGVLAPVCRPVSLRIARATGHALTAAGVSECLTWAFHDPDRLALVGWRDPSRLLVLDNALSRERSVLRPSLVPGLMEVLAVNAHRQAPDVQAFEIGTVFAPRRPDDGDRPAHEELWLGIAVTGLRAGRAWHAAKERVDVYDVKGLAELALAAVGAQAETASWPAAAPGSAAVESPPGDPAGPPGYLDTSVAARLRVAGQDVGWFGEVAGAVRAAYDLPAPVFVAELSLTALLALPTLAPRFQPLPRFPAVQRDLAVVVGAGVTAAEIEAAIRAAAPAWLTRIALFDVYQGSQVGPGRRSLAWGLTFQAPDRTLTDAEVNEVHARIVAEITKRFDAEVRGA